MNMSVTKVANLVNPEVMAPMVSATLPKQIKFSPIAAVDNTLVEQPGNTITVPKYAYIGDAEDVAEGVAMGTTVLSASSTKVTVKKAGKAIEITDEAVLSGYGDPVGEGTTQLGMSIAAKIDNDCYATLLTAPLKHNGVAKAIGYEGVVDAVDKFEDENDENTDMIIFVHPKQVTQLRKDPNFLSKDKFPIEDGVIMTGMIGKIAGCKVVKSKKVKLNSGSTGYENPIVVVDLKDPNEDPAADKTATNAPALTIYLKRDVMLETDRDILKKTTVASADEHYAVALSNESKVVVATFKKEG